MGGWIKDFPMHTKTCQNYLWVLLRHTICHIKLLFSFQAQTVNISATINNVEHRNYRPSAFWGHLPILACCQELTFFFLELQCSWRQIRFQSQWDSVKVSIRDQLKILSNSEWVVFFTKWKYFWQIIIHYS